ncbi:hypothetical protein U1Q18_040623 [Sarracenia purpurea var. burkii]
MRSSKNHFGVLANLDSDEHFPSLIGTKKAGEVTILDSERTPYHVFRDAADLRLQLLLMNRDQSLDRQSKSMKGLSPLRIKNLTMELQSTAGSKSQRGASPVDKNEAEKEGIPNLLPIEQGLLTTTMFRNFPDEGKGAGHEILKEANPKVEEEGLSYGGVVIDVSAVEQAQPDGESSVDSGLTCEEDETSDEEVDPLVGEEIQKGTEASEC